MELFVRRLVLLHALFSAWCTAQQRTGDGRVILNLGYITSYSGDYISGGKRALTACMAGRRWDTSS